MEGTDMRTRFGLSALILLSCFCVAPGAWAQPADLFDDRAEDDKPSGADPDAGDPDAGDPDAGDPDAGDPDAGDPDAGDPDGGDPDGGDPDGGNPDGGDPAGDPDDGRAATGQGDHAAAESLARVGKGLMELGQYAEACPKLEQSMDAAADGDVSMLLGECYERQGRLAAAWATYRQGAALLRATGSSRAEVLAARAVALEPKVPKLTLLAREVRPGMRVLRDDTRFGAGILGVPVAVDPGAHRIEVTAEGFQPWSTEIELKASERRTLEIPPLKRAAPTKPDAVAVSTGHGSLFYAGVISAGAGAASLAVGALLAASASRDVRVAETNDTFCGPDRLCTQDGLDLIATADAKAIGATVTLSVGAAAIAAGFIMVIVDPGASPAERSLSFAPLVLPKGGGAAASIRF
jgi:hypothetical protein